MHRCTLLLGAGAGLLPARPRAATVWKLATGYRAESEELRRLGERFALEWIREVGPQANAIFIPYHPSSTS